MASLLKYERCEGKDEVLVGESDLSILLIPKDEEGEDGLLLRILGE